MTRGQLAGFDGALYLLIDEPQKHTGDWREPSHGKPLRAGDMYQLVHVMSRPAGGEVRGYILSGGVAHVRYPATPQDWPEVDAAVMVQLACDVVPAKVIS